MNEIETEPSTLATSRQAPPWRPLDERTYRAAVQAAAKLVPWVDEKIVNHLADDKLSADTAGAVCALLNKLRLSGAEAEIMLFFTLQAANLGENRHEIKSAVTKLGEVYRKKADILESILTEEMEGYFLPISERAAVLRLIRYFRDQADVYKKTPSLMSIDKKPNAPNAHIFAAARRLKSAAEARSIPNLTASQIRTLLSIALNVNIPPATIREALRDYGDSDSIKKAKSRVSKKPRKKLVT